MANVETRGIPLRSVIVIISTYTESARHPIRIRVVPLTNQRSRKMGRGEGRGMFVSGALFPDQYFFSLLLLSPSLFFLTSQAITIKQSARSNESSDNGTK